MENHFKSITTFIKSSLRTGLAFTEAVGKHYRTTLVLDDFSSQVFTDSAMTQRLLDTLVHAAGDFVSRLTYKIVDDTLVAYVDKKYLPTDSLKVDVTNHYFTDFVNRYNTEQTETKIIINAYRLSQEDEGYDNALMGFDVRIIKAISGTHCASIEFKSLLTNKDLDI